MREEPDGGDAADACGESARADGLRHDREHAAKGPGRVYADDRGYCRRKAYN